LILRGIRSVAAQVACERAKFVTGFPRWVKGQAQGLEPGAFKLWVNCIYFNLYGPTAAACSSGVSLFGNLAVAVHKLHLQTNLENQFETSFSLDRLKG
jgi:hypothetical protein